MKYKRTVKERKVAIERLKLNKKKCPRHNYFGENNHQKIDIMIDVINKERSPEWIDKTYTSCNKLGEEDINEHGKWVAAINARDYLKGEEELYGKEYFL